MQIVRLPHQVPLLQQPPRRNDCGPHAAAMAIGYYRPADCDVRRVARQMSFLRVPLLGATLPWAIARAVGREGLRAVGGWFSNLDAVRTQIATGHPVVVIVKPSDFPSCPWYALHYRVAVGYREDPSLPGGGELYFNCSAVPPPESPTGVPGNVRIDYALFRRQWHTYLTHDWAVAVLPGGQSL